MTQNLSRTCIMSLSSPKCWVVSNVAGQSVTDCVIWHVRSQIHLIPVGLEAIVYSRTKTRESV